MMHDFNKPPHVASQEEIAHKKKLPVYILIIVGVFLLALLIFMLADHQAKASVTTTSLADLSWVHIHHGDEV